MKDETFSRTIWQWEKSDWQGNFDALTEAPWDEILTYKSKSTDRP